MASATTMPLVTKIQEMWLCYMYILNDGQRQRKMLVLYARTL